MRRKILLLFLLFPFFHSWSQNPASVFQIPNRNLNLACGACVNITARVPHLKQTTDYVITTIPYQPFAYTSTTGVEVTETYDDDTWSNKIRIGFPFCFYGITYPTLLMGSNSNISFDSSLAGDGSGYVIEGETIPSADYARASIFGPYHDIDPSSSNNPAPSNRRIEYRVEGTAPKRRFIASYNDVGYYDCFSSKATHQMVLYEATGVIEVYIKDKPTCPDWNDGHAILGVQDQTRTKGVAAPGKNATAWGTTGMNEAYRFTPSGAAPRFRNAVLLLDGNIIATADSASATAGLLDLNFPSVCTTRDSAAYVLRVTYGLCNDPSQDVSFFDTVYVKTTRPVIDLVTQNATCTSGGSITANLTNAAGTYQYSLNGTAQAGNVFNNLPAGSYSVTAQNGGCFAFGQVTVPLTNTLVVNALPSDTSICAGASFTPRVTSNATAYSWTPTGNIASPSQMQPVITTSSESTNYIVTVSQGQCVSRDTIRATVFPGATVNAGPDIAILPGDQVQLLAQAAAGTYLWTPATGLNNATALNPVASPAQTTTYTLQVTTASGCVSTDQVVVSVQPGCVQPMEAFTPNGDGVNDLWLVTNGSCIRSARAEVFNRYGNKVFESQNYNNDWNGTYKGKPLPDGTYYFVITYQLVSGRPVYLKGNVTILR
ncbi:MAG TPA: gliding motility-associated C-terminal domain-containing protein [Flavisolibacter sp.]|nr:gliding motility-associated C-terminal domain-containing protein [Flavisolibacter sp.]